MGPRSDFKVCTAYPPTESAVQSLNVNREIGLYLSFTYRSFQKRA